MELLSRLLDISEATSLPSAGGHSLVASVSFLGAARMVPATTVVTSEKKLLRAQQQGQKQNPFIVFFSCSRAAVERTALNKKSDSQASGVGVHQGRPD